MSGRPVQRRVSVVSGARCQTCHAAVMTSPAVLTSGLLAGLSSLRRNRPTRHSRICGGGRRVRRRTRAGGHDVHHLPRWCLVGKRLGHTYGRLDGRDGRQGAVETAKFGADLLAAGVADLIERAYCLSPGPARGVHVADAAMDIAEVIEGARFVKSVGKLPAQVKGAFIAGDGAPVAAEPVMDVAQAVPGGGLPIAFSGFLAAGQGTFAVADGLPVVPEQGVAVTDIIQARDL